MLKQKLIELEHKYNLITNKYISKSDLREGLTLISNLINTKEESIRALQLLQKIPLNIFWIKSRLQKGESIKIELNKGLYLLNYLSNKGDPEVVKMNINCALREDTQSIKDFRYDIYNKEWFMLKLDFVKWLQIIKKCRTKL